MVPAASAFMSVMDWVSMWVSVVLVNGERAKQAVRGVIVCEFWCKFLVVVFCGLIGGKVD
jgi:hypothetical protein